MAEAHPVPAWVLHRRSYRDTSLLLELLTRDHGRVGVVARGARRQKSRWRGVLEPFQPVLANWAGRGELGTLVFAEAGGRPVRITGTRLAGAFYLSELVLRLLRREDPAPAVFDAYGDALLRLADGTEPEDAPLRRFEKRLLEALGYGLLLDAEAESGAALEPETVYRFELEHGPVASSPGAGGLRISSGALLALAADDYRDAARRAEMQKLTGSALRLYLGERPLRSRALYVSLRRGGGRLGNEEPAS